jgi:UDP-N-acetylglucosamine--N-acetylmuramyl-(pentapeptide) pyrophosphoryl-undecaprenol N-acetylglucosamine transferase
VAAIIRNASTSHARFASGHSEIGNLSVNSETVNRLALDPERAFRLIVTGGGFGGHTYPAVTAMRTLTARLSIEGRRLDVLWVGTAGGLEARVAAEEGIRFATVATGKVRRARNPLRMASPANVRA